MQVKTLEQLTERDPTLRAFGRLQVVTRPGGQQDLVQREVTLESIQRMVSECDLAPDVPEHVRDHFETCRALHAHGYFNYSFFTAVVQRVYTTLEAALGARLVEHYCGEIPLTQRRTGQQATFTVASYARLDEALHGDFRHSGKKGWELDGHPDFDGSMSSLLAWARKKHLLHGQRNRVVEDAILFFRNAGVHPHGPYRISQNESAEAISEVAEIINHLWGHDTLGGRLYGGPMPMELFAVSWSADGADRMCCFAALLPVLGESDVGAVGRWYLIEAAEEGDLLQSWSPDRMGYEATAYPSSVIWTGDSLEDAVRALQEYKAAGRAPQPREWRDRLFLVRHGGGSSEPCRSPEQFRRLPEDERDRLGKRWRIVRSDHPSAGEDLGDFASWGEAEGTLTELERLQ